MNAFARWPYRCTSPATRQKRMPRMTIEAPKKSRVSNRKAQERARDLDQLQQFRVFAGGGH